jgi:hypothetical protein
MSISEDGGSDGGDGRYGSTSWIARILVLSEETDPEWATFFASESGEHATCSSVAKCFQKHEITPQIKMIDLMCTDMCGIYKHPVGGPRHDYHFIIPMATSLGRDPVRLWRLQPT